MTELTIELELPDQLVEEARNAGLLSSETIERLLCEHMRQHGADEAFEMAGCLAAVDSSPMNDNAVPFETDAVSHERRRLTGP